MVQRRLLTAEFVNSVKSPQKGEQWIADTKIKGFGLRIFASNGIGKSFAIRVSDESGMAVRKTFDIYSSWTYRWGVREGGSEFEFGDFLEDARDWARNEIYRLKNLEFTAQEQSQQWQQTKRLVEEMTLKRAAEGLLNRMKMTDRTQGYVDRLGKLFTLWIPAELKATSLLEVTPPAMAQALVSPGLSWGNARVLRSFIGQIFERASDYGVWSEKFKEELYKELRRRWKRDYNGSLPKLRELKQIDYQKVFEFLETQEERWQQALCIRLYFEIRAPLSRLVRARWSRLYGGAWYPYLPSEKKYWFESREHLRDGTAKLIARINQLATRDFQESKFLFPSPDRNEDVPISTIESMWRRALRECGLNYHPLPHFAARFGRRPNNPTYYMSLLNQYGEAWRAWDNASELAKIIRARDETPITAAAYAHYDLAS